MHTRTLAREAVKRVFRNARPSYKNNGNGVASATYDLATRSKFDDTVNFSNAAVTLPISEHMTPHLFV